MTLDDAAAHLRSKRNLRVLESGEEGFALPALPAGVYGFTWSPNFEETPLFGKKSFQAFEFHTMADGAVELVGYMTAADAERLRSGEAGMEVNLYPDAWQDAQEPVSVPMAHIVRSKRRPARDNGCPYTLRLV